MSKQIDAPEAKAQCEECNCWILRSTADRNRGRCEPCASGAKFVNIAEGMELGMRLCLGFFFMFLIGGMGYGIGACVATLVGLVVAIPFGLIGFTYGCFCVEINAMVRSIVPFFFN